MKIAVIPARGGSRRIPLKNIRNFCGKPIIAYSIEQALASKLFDQVIVSTDSEEIASVARDYGAKTPFLRPANISGDFTGTNAVVKHAINWYKQHNQAVSFSCCIYATAPFLQVNFLREAHDKLINSNKSFAFSVTTFPFPIQRALQVNHLGEIKPFWPKQINSRSQDLQEAYHDAGQFYWGRSEAFIQEQTVFSCNSLPIILPRHLVQDIDTHEDWLRAELMFKSLKEREKQHC